MTSNQVDVSQANKPLPASKVFSARALPLYLPALDTYLSQEQFSCPPEFDSTEAQWSQAEQDLFTLELLPGEVKVKGQRFHIGGRQLKITDKTLSSDSSSSVTSLIRRTGFRAVANDDPEEGTIKSVTSPCVYPPRYTAANLPCTPPVVPASSPLASQREFPPLMLLKTSSLRELKSNAVGPRKPPGGFLASLPGLTAVLSTVIDLVIGAEGSTTAASIINLSLFIDFAQMIRNNLHFQEDAPGNQESPSHKLLTSTLPSILALDFVSVFGLAIIFWFLWIVVVLLALVWYVRMTSAYDPNRDVQGFEGQPYLFRSPKRRSKLANIIVTFLLTAFYLPLSKLCIDALVWGSAFWPDQTGLSDIQLQLPASSVLRAADDFCYTTTMQKDDFNWAWIIVPLSSAVLLVYTVYFPVHLRRVIRNMSPKVSSFDEQGIKRSGSEISSAYKRMLLYDKSPLAYLYNGYRVSYATYKPLYLIYFKLTTLITVAVCTSQNCLWRKVDPQKMLVAQQAILIGVQSILLGVHLATKPFIDATSNRSELCSRISYVLLASIGLLVAIRVQGEHVLRTGIIYTIQAFSYGFNIYFALINKDFTAHLVKRCLKRLDFSIDIHNPVLNLEKHVARRVWQETLSILLLAGEEYRMPLGSTVSFSKSEKWPPYLLFFKGTVAERHVENLKIVQEIGLEEYTRQVGRLRGPGGKMLRAVLETIQLHFTGPDAYFRPKHPPFPQGVDNWFGKAFLFPFPPTLVIRYDQQGGKATLQLTTLEDFDDFVKQNSKEEIKERRKVRVVLRALDGQVVSCPYVAQQPLQRRQKGRKRFSVPIIYAEGMLKVKVQEFPAWESYNFSAGYDVSIIFTRGRRQDPEGETWIEDERAVPACDAFGLDDHFCLSQQVGDFFARNESLILERRPAMMALLRRYRRKFYEEARSKEDTLSYGFLVDVFEGNDRSNVSKDELLTAFRHASEVQSVQDLPLRYPASMDVLYKRLAQIRRSKVHTFWWLWWDDLYRTNGADYRVLRTHRTTFSARYATSIAYRPMPRAALEALLADLGLWTKEGGTGILNRGEINRLYFTLNRIVFDAGRGGSCTEYDPPSYISQGKEGRSPTEVVTTTGGRCPEIIEVGQGSASALIVPHTASTLDGSLRLPNIAMPPSHNRWPGSRFTGGAGGEDEGEDGGGVIENRPAYRWEQLLGGRPQIGWGGKFRDRCLQALSLRPYADDKHLAGLWIFVEEKEGKLVLQGRPSGGGEV